MPDRILQSKREFGNLGLLIIGIVLSALSIFFFIAEEYFLIALIVAVLGVLFILSDIKKYIIYSFIASIFIGGYIYWPLRIQVINLVAYLLFFYFFTNFNTSIFNSLKLPHTVKFSWLLLMGTAVLALVNSYFLSPLSIYLTYLFFTFLFSFYIVFKSIHSIDQVELMIKFFLYCTAISGVIIIFQIMYTSFIRSLGLTSYAIMDISAMSLVTLLLMYFILGKSNTLIKIVTAITFLILITTLSRFAWLGFTLSFIYGITISAIFARKYSNFLKDRVLMFIMGGIIVLGIFFATGLHNIVIDRFTDVDTELFAQDAEDSNFNSLETRVLIWVVAANTFSNNMWTGVGYQMFPQVSEEYNILPLDMYDIFVRDLDAHTTYLNILVDMGIIGLISFLVFVFIIWWVSYKSIKYSRNLNEIRISIALNTLIFFVVIHSIYSGAFTLGQNAFSFYFFAGLAVANYCLLRKDYVDNL